MDTVVGRERGTVGWQVEDIVGQVGKVDWLEGRVGWQEEDTSALGTVGWVGIARGIAVVDTVGWWKGMVGWQQDRGIDQDKEIEYWKEEGTAVAAVVEVWALRVTLQQMLPVAVVAVNSNVLSLCCDLRNRFYRCRCQCAAP